MQEDILLQISNNIRARRKEIGITVQELADRAGVSKGLISQIENSRTIPSLIVLIGIINALDMDLNIFFREIGAGKKAPPILIKRRSEYQYFEKEYAEGFHYHRVFSRSVKNAVLDMVLLELDPNASRPLVQTEAFEYKYIISGSVTFDFDGHEVQFHEGDSMLFDGRIPHTPRNTGVSKAAMLVVYFFESEGAV